MKIHEHQAKEILARHDVPVPKGKVAFSVDEALDIARGLGKFPVVVKAQIHAGGRGKGGGVKLAKNEQEVRQYAAQILGMQLVTHQTGPEGKKVLRLLIEEGVDIRRELYAGLLLDRAVAQNVFMVSTEGGMEIEKVAAETPEKIVKVHVNPATGFQAFHARRLAFALGLSGAAFKSAIHCFTAMYRAFEDADASLVEVNPLVETGDGRIIALDAKVNLDDNGLFRHPDVVAMRDLTEEDPAEVEASKSNLNYIKLDGNVGCMVNGAGLAMATMDIIKLHGGMPANFLDVGGTASAETTAEGFRIILSDKNVRAVLINIFGGIVRCDRVAGGVIEAVKKTKISVPVVIRLEGTNADVAAKMLSESGLSFVVATDLTDAAKKAVAAVKA
ncbi:ADP-forming succinate--CoA ligase subunit beta [bacterium]|nr:ADP-forming succinate--CoA ligase subunit beta [bacterium]MBU1984908.1 ADP-forming succinate--CoA ligase subunit beta [bacterium]